MAVTRFILQAPGTGIVSRFDVLARVEESVDSTIFGGWNCGRSLNCKMWGRFENFSSASGRDLVSLTGFSPWAALSEGLEGLDRISPSSGNTSVCSSASSFGGIFTSGAVTGLEAGIVSVLFKSGFAGSG